MILGIDFLTFFFIFYNKEVFIYRQIKEIKIININNIK